MVDVKKTIIQAILSDNIDSLKQNLVGVKNVNFKDQYGDRLLHLAVNKNNVEIVKLLLEKGAKPDKKNSFRETPLYCICNRTSVGDLEIPKLLLDAGADANFKKTKKAYSLLHLSIMTKNLGLAKILLNANADPNENENRDCWTPLFFAWNKKSIELLINAGADVDVAGKNGISPVGLSLSYTEKEDPGFEMFKLLFSLSEEAKNNISKYIDLAKKEFKNDIVEFLKTLKIK